MPDNTAFSEILRGLARSRCCLAVLRQPLLFYKFVVNLGNRRDYIQSTYAIPNQGKMQQERASLTHTPNSFKKL